MEETFNHEQSLSLINEMIQRAQNNVNKGKTYSFIILGYVLAAAAIAIYVLLHTLSNPNQSFWVWLVIVPAMVAMNFVERRINGEKYVKTHIEKIGGMVWAGFGISSVVFIAVVFTITFNTGTNTIFLLCTPVILTMVGMAQFITACVFRNEMWYLIAIVYWVGSLACTFLNGDAHMIIFAVCMLLGYAFPGHLLLHKAKKSHV